MARMVDGFVARARRRRAVHLSRLIANIASKRGGCRIVDLGGEGAYWDHFGLDALQAQGVRITLVNPKPERVDHPVFTVIEADACDLPGLEASSFDLAHSNSTLEHVGEWSRMKAFAAQMRRLAPAYYVQTPYVWFPIEPHFLALGFHWTPEPMRVRAMMRRRHGHHPQAADVEAAMEAVRSARLLDRTQFRALFPDAEHATERFMGLPKSLIAERTSISSRPTG